MWAATTVVVADVRPAGAQVGAAFPAYTGNQFNELFRTAPLGNLGAVGPLPSITGAGEIDGLIRAVAEGRGYRRRPLPAGPLGSADGFWMQPEAAAAWEALQAEALRVGFQLRIVSAFRDHAQQRAIFLRRLSGYSVAAIDARLRSAAPPGYSKHHTGYALDITQAGYAHTGFGSSPAFAWLAADNYANAKRFGFIPSYPADATRQGPNPEPWEYTYVGVEAINCGGLNLGIGATPATAVAALDALLGCPGYPMTVGATAATLARVFGLNGAAPSGFVDDDNTPFEADIAAVAAASIVEACDPEGPTVCPYDYVSRGQAATFLARALQLGEGPDAFVDDNGHRFETDINRLAAAGAAIACSPEGTSFCPDALVTRVDLAGLLTRALGLQGTPGRLGFADDDGSVHEADIQWLASEGITVGCNPPFNTRFCPDLTVTRAQMATFFVRAFDLMPASAGGVAFADTTGSPHAADIATAAAAGLTAGCNPEGTLFCPDDPITRGQAAAFLARALGLPSGATSSFIDDDGSIFEADIARIAAAGITAGCTPDGTRFCPDQPVSRAQLATLLRRATGTKGGG